MRISKKLREEFSSVSTGSKYYETKGHAIQSFERVLASHSAPDNQLEFAPFDMPNNHGATVADIVDETGARQFSAYLSWYRMPSGRYEIVGYIS